MKKELLIPYSIVKAVQMLVKKNGERFDHNHICLYSNGVKLTVFACTNHMAIIGTMAFNHNTGELPEGVTVGFWPESWGQIKEGPKGTDIPFTFEIADSLSGPIVEEVRAGIAGFNALDLAIDKTRVIGLTVAKNLFPHETSGLVGDYDFSQLALLEKIAACLLGNKGRENIKINQNGIEAATIDLCSNWQAVITTLRLGN